MQRSPRPSTILAHSLDRFLTHVPALREGEEKAIHDARVAIRRTREAIALTRDEFLSDPLEDVEERLRRAFRSLGQARDADVAQHLVRHVESRFSDATRVVAQLRMSVGRSQLAARRKLLKTLEALDVDELPEQLARAHRRHRLPFRRPSWPTLLRSHLTQRARDLQEAIIHSGGVYLPNRSHSARVSIKQLRYGLELADVLGLGRPSGLRRLRRAQEALGQVHDRELLLERLHELEAEHRSLKQRQVMALEHFVDAEIRELHEGYLSLRSELLEICHAAAAIPREGSFTMARAAAATAVALPVAVLLRQRFKSSDDLL